MTGKPFSQACENNKEPILNVLQRHLNFVHVNPIKILEIGSGTGQHAIYFAQELPQLQWCCTDRSENLSGIDLWIEDTRLENIVSAELDVNWKQWPYDNMDAVFSANTAHIMSWKEVELMLHGVAYTLKKTGLFFLYGPFNYNGSYTSVSNANFDKWLVSQNRHSAIRDVEKIVDVAGSVGLVLIEDNAMPANNRMLVFQK
jgi:cyclopropane fatty-acyl-phospholipid synthase-like methyltransferase